MINPDSSHVASVKQKLDINSTPYNNRACIFTITGSQYGFDKTKFIFINPNEKFRISMYDYATNGYTSDSNTNMSKRANVLLLKWG
jgi:hypothetical protein